MVNRGERPFIGSMNFKSRMSFLRKLNFSVSASLNKITKMINIYDLRDFPENRHSDNDCFCVKFEKS